MKKSVDCGRNLKIEQSLDIVKRCGFYFVEEIMSKFPIAEFRLKIIRDFISERKSVFRGWKLFHNFFLKIKTTSLDNTRTLFDFQIFDHSQLIRLFNTLEEQHYSISMKSSPAYILSVKLTSIIKISIVAFQSNISDVDEVSNECL